uniref:Uncharacterized protein n=1 Tax=Nelumbo nucifera TaxID=4432 RepID=A0A822YSQ6_NELNU|nr:TPA_asm: hypothetical protein HUJ06_011109 [Nelumbo nucifera]
MGLLVLLRLCSVVFLFSLLFQGASFISEVPPGIFVQARDISGTPPPPVAPGPYYPVAMAGDERPIHIEPAASGL